MIHKFDWLLYIGFWCVAQSQTWGPTTSSPTAAFLPATTPLLSPNYYLSLPTMTAALADTRMESTAYYGNVKTVASQNAAGAIQILYEYYTAATAGAAASYSIGQILVPKVTGTCASSCLLGYAIDAGESLSTKDILISGATDWNSNQGAAFIFKDVGFRFSQQAQLYARDGSANDLFGYSVSLEEFNPRRAFIGAPGDDDKGSGSGSVYFFESSPTAKYWTEAQKLVALGTNAGDRFGAAVEVDGRFAIVTAPGQITYPPDVLPGYSGSCTFYTFEQEKPKPPPKPDPCQDSKGPKTLRGLKAAELQSADVIISKTFMTSVSPFADIKQTKSLQWSQQQSFSTTGCQGDLQISMYESDLAVGNQFKDNPGWVYLQTFLKDTGEVITYTRKTVRAPCTSSLFNTVLTFTELVEMRDMATMQFWEEWGAYDDNSNSSCKRPKPGPKPTPICETTRWSQHQVIVAPDVYNCSYFGSAVDMYGDYMVITARNMRTGGADNCFHDGSEPTTWQDGGFYVYHKDPANGQWTMIQKFTRAEVDPTLSSGEYGLVGSPIQLTGTDILASYAGASAAPGNKIIVTDTNYECVMFDLGDQFGDGWGGAELVITQQDGVQERYAPYCSSAGLNLGRYFRWCPHNQTMCGEITLEIPRAEEFPFHWEIIWGVLMEETDVWVYGGYDTKMVFNWDCDRKDLSLVSATHVVANETCDSGCQKFEPTMRPTPAKPKPDRTPDSKSPTPMPTTMPPTDARRLDEESSQDELTSKWRDEMAPDASLSAIEALAPENPPRQLKKSKQPSTHHPTISPAPTLVDTQNAYEHWEFLKLIDDGTGNWFSPFGRSTEYYISDIHGKHLFKSGTKCANGALTLSCWQTLPPNGEFILRIGGNMNTNAATHTANFCGKTLERQSQLVFSINNHKCTPISYFTAQRYCTSYLDLQVTMHGILLIHGVQLNTLSAVDTDVLQQAFASVFNSHTSVDLDAKAKQSTEGTVLTFSVSVSITNFGYEQTDFEAEETVAQTAFTLLSESFDSVTFSSAFDEQVSAYSMRGTPSSFTGHGSISLQMLSDPTFDDKGPTEQSQLDPIIFISQNDKSSFSFTSHPLFNAGAFVAVLVVGLLAMAIYRHRTVPASEKARDFDEDTEHGIGKAGSIASSTASFFNTMGFNVPPTGSVYEPIDRNSEHAGEALVPSKSSNSRKSGSSSGSSKKKSSSKSSSSSVDKEKSSTKSRKSSSSSSRSRSSGSTSSRSRSSSRALSEDSSGSDDEAADLALLLQESSRRRSDEKKGKFQPSQRSHQSPTSGDTAGFNVDTLVKALADSAVNLSDEE